jgi:hypothetical protein
MTEYLAYATATNYRTATGRGRKIHLVEADNGYRAICHSGGAVEIRWYAGVVTAEHVIAAADRPHNAHCARCVAAAKAVA